MSSNIQPHVSFSEVFCHPLERLDSSQKKKLACITIACGILFPVIGGVIAFFATSAIFKNKNIKLFKPQDTPVTPVARAVLQPGKPITVSDQCKALLDCFGMRPNEQNQFDSNQLKDLIKKIYKSTPHEIFDITDTTGLEESPKKLEPFLQRVNDYNLSLFIPVRWDTQPSSLKENITKGADLIRKGFDKEDFTQATTYLSISSDKRITCIPQEVFKFTNLTTLMIASDTLIGVSSKIGDLTHLQELWITSSPFVSEIPSEIGKLQELVAVNFSALSQLQKLPDQICDLPKLATIILTQSGITELPKQISKLPLISLACQGCKLNISEKLKEELTTKLDIMFQTGSVLPFKR